MFLIKLINSIRIKTSFFLEIININSSALKTFFRSSLNKDSQLALATIVTLFPLLLSLLQLYSGAWCGWEIFTTTLRLSIILAATGIILTQWPTPFFSKALNFHLGFFSLASLLWIPLVWLLPDLPLWSPLLCLVSIPLVFCLYAHWTQQQQNPLQQRSKHSPVARSYPSAPLLNPGEGFKLIFGTYDELRELSSHSSSHVGFAIDSSHKNLQLWRKPLLPLTSLDKELYLLPHDPPSPYNLILLPGAFNDYEARMTILNSTLTLPCRYIKSFPNKLQQTLIAQDLIQFNPICVDWTCDSIMIIGLGEDMALDFINMIPSSSNLIIVESSDKVLESLTCHYSKLVKKPLLVLGNSWAIPHLASLINHHKPKSVVVGHPFSSAARDHNSAFYAETHVFALQRLIKVCQEAEVALLLNLWSHQDAHQSSLQISQALGTLYGQVYDQNTQGLRCLSLQWPHESLETFIQTTEDQLKTATPLAEPPLFPLISRPQRLACLRKSLASYTTLPLGTSLGVTSRLNPEIVQQLLRKLSLSAKGTHLEKSESKQKTTSPPLDKTTWEAHLTSHTLSSPLPLEIIEEKLAWLESMMPPAEPSHHLHWAMKSILSTLSSSSS